jgi:hypothetical protein
MLVQNAQQLAAHGLLNSAPHPRNVLSSAAEAEVFDILAALATCLPGADTDGACAALDTARLEEQRGVYLQCGDFLAQQVQALLALASPLQPAHAAMVEQRLCALIAAYTSLLRHVEPRSIAQFSACVEQSFGVCAYLLRQFPRMATMRGKLLNYLHHYIEKLGVSGVSAGFPQVLEHYLAQLSCGEVEQVVSLFTQLIVLHSDQPQLQALVAHFHPRLMALFQSLLQDFEAQARSASSAGAGAVQEPAHIEVERLAVDRSVLLYLQHVIGHRLEAVLYAHSSMQAVYAYLLASLRGGALGGAAVTKSLSLPQRRSSLVCLHTLVDNLHVQAASLDMAAPHLRTLRAFLLEHALPHALLSLGEPRALQGQGVYSALAADYCTLRLNLQDAASQGVVGEVAALLYSLCRCRALSQPRSVCGFLQELLARRLRWDEALVQQLTAPLLAVHVAAVSGPGEPRQGQVQVPALANFKDHLKQLLRQHM